VRLVALLVGCAAALLSCAAATAASSPNAADLESELVCPVCETTLDQSNSPAAERMKLYIRHRIAAGASAQQIKDELVAEYGQGVLARPPKGGFGLLAWILPLAALLAGAIAVTLLIRSWAGRRSTPVEDTALDPELDRLVDDELARFDG
jgi:cytochrome c-type biogenesis protein CcmH